MSAVMVKSRTGTQRDEMLWTVHRAVRLLLTPPPLNCGALNVPRAVSSALTLPVAHNHPAIQSKRQVNVLPGCLAATPALPPSLSLPCLLPTEGSACWPASFSSGQVGCIPLVNEPWLPWLLFCSCTVSTCLFHPLENEFLQGRSRTWVSFILRT